MTKRKEENQEESPPKMSIKVMWLEKSYDSKCDLPAFSKKILNGIDLLYTLDLSNILLSDVPRNLSYALANAEELLLQNNMLTTLPIKLFHYSKQLRSIDLSNNNLSKLDK